MDRKPLWMVLTELVVLMGIVALVDSVLLRTGLALALALLLVQRALEGGKESDAGVPDTTDRRRNHVFRGYVSQLLMRIRQIYATCHLVSTKQISPEKASAQVKEIEKELHRLMSELLEAAKTNPERLTVEALTEDLPLIT